MTTDRYRLGHDVLGPAFATFARLLLDEAIKDGMTRLAFIARDGELLLDMTARMIDHLRLREPPRLEYVYLSRLSTILPQYQTFGEAARAEAAAIFGARPTNLASFLAYFGIDAGTLGTVLHSLDLSPSTEVRSLRDLDRLINDPAFSEVAALAIQRQRDLLERYLDQSGLLADRGCAYVDLGWRGSIPAALGRTFPDRPGAQPVRCYYFGYWDERDTCSLGDAVVKGLVSDYRRRPTPREGSSFYLAYLLEAVCRAAHGTVLGYERDAQGRVIPCLAEGSTNRDAERAGERWRQPIRQGIDDFIAENGERYAATASAALLRDAQRRLFRLAFFPRPEELEAVSGLAHTEGHVPDWVKPLVENAAPSPFRAPRLWMVGLSSPWRSGYVMATGGRPLAWAFVALECLLLAFPKVRRRLRNLALRLAGPS